MSDFEPKAVGGSFRDPSGLVFFINGTPYRQINLIYKNDYDHLIGSGLYKTLTDENLLIPHEEVDMPDAKSEQVYKIIKPDKIPFISYPYEWCFSQLKDAALAILNIQKIALGCGMSLKDASAYNIQFREARPLLIDTLSFEKYSEGRPWAAYRQFCQHFLAPLALMSLKDIRLGQLLRIYIDGLPLDLASKLLPMKSRFILPLFIHIHLHARFQGHFADKSIDKHRGGMSRQALISILNSLRTGIKRMKPRADTTVWADYYKKTDYATESFEHKKRLVAGYLDEAGPGLVWDIGANTGLFSRLASDKGLETVSFDNDIFCVETNYRQCQKNGDKKILPLVLDLANPSPGIGWENRERMSLLERGPAKTVLALALIHHLAISNNLPFKRIAEFFSETCECLIVEYVPKEDPQVKRLLASREDIFADYGLRSFEDDFLKYFDIIASEKIRTSQRVLYLMKRK